MDAIGDPRIGLDFGDYKVTRKIAEGGMGAVYLAEHFDRGTATGMRKVVKFMLGEALKIPAVRKRFEIECRAAQRLKGRAGIVEIDSFGERNGEMYLVMEYLDGVTLEAHIAQNVRLTEHHTAHILFLILRALAVLHKEDIVHRDLKPSNVFLRDTDERKWDPTLIDFGIVHDNRALRTDSFATRDGQTIGTVGFMATEQYGKANQATPATDVFACAVMMWLMLTGQLPWGLAETDYAQYDRQLHHAPVWPAHVSLTYAPAWREILVDALAADPARRPQTAQLFALLLAQALNPIPPHVPSGLAMLEKLAPKFFADLPAELETVRHPNGRIEVASLWSPHTPGAVLGRGSAGDIGGNSSGSSLSFNAIRVSAVTPAPHVSAPTIHARPPASTPTPSTSTPSAAPAGTMPAMTTTLSAANGSHTPSMPRARLAAIGIGTALAATLAIGAVAIGVGRMGSRSPNADSIAPAAAPSGGPERDMAPSAPLSPAAETSPGPTTDVTSGSGSAVATPATPVVPERAVARPDHNADDAPAVTAPTSATTAHTASSFARATETPASSSRPRSNERTASKPARSATPSSDPARTTTTQPAPRSAPTSGSGAGAGSAREKTRFDPDAIKE